MVGASYLNLSVRRRKKSEMYGVGCCRAGARRESPLDEPGAKETIVIEVVSSKLNSP